MRKLMISMLLLCMGQAMHAENTDVSGIDNVIYISPFAVKAGTQNAVISIKMKNKAVIRSFQFDLYLPDGVTVAKSAKGKIQGALNADRLPEEDAHLLTFSEHTEGDASFIRFLCDSQDGDTFTGSDGELITLKVNVAEDMTPGDYAIQMKEMKLSETDISKFYKSDLVETTVYVASATDMRTLLHELWETAPTAATGVDVRVRRTLVADMWNTLCLPFSMTAAQVQAAFGNDVELAEFSGWESEKNGAGEVTIITVNFTTITAITKNRPCLIKVKSNKDEFTVDGVDIDPAENPSLQIGSGTELGVMKGTYVAFTTIPMYNLFLNGNNFWYSVGKTKSKAFRAYFELAEVLASVENAASRIKLSMSGNGGTTGIRHIGDSVKDDVYYNLQGQRVEQPGKGLYIKDGKVIMNK